MGPQAAMSNLQIYFRLHLCPLRLLPFPLDYNFRISSRLSNFMFSTSIHTFWTSRFICFRPRFLYIRLRIQNIRRRIQNIRLRIQNIRLRLQKQWTSIEILLFVFLSATERHTFFRLSLFSAFPSFPRFFKKQKPLRRREKHCYFSWDSSYFTWKPNDGC